MANVRRALRGWKEHLREVIGVDDAAAVVDEFDHHVTFAYFDRGLEAAFDRHWIQVEGAIASSEARLRSEMRDVMRDAMRDAMQDLEARMRRDIEASADHLEARLAAAWRKDLLIHASGQFFALVAAVAALVLLF